MGEDRQAIQSNGNRVSSEILPEFGQIANDSDWLYNWNIIKTVSLFALINLRLTVWLVDHQSLMGIQQISSGGWYYQ